MGAVISFFRLVGIFIVTIPQSIVCIVKLLTIGYVNFLLMLPPFSYITVTVLNMWVWLFNVLLKLGMFLFFAVLGIVLALVDVLAGEALGLKDSIGNQVRVLSVVLTACENDPRSWYRTPHWHTRNRYDRLFGLGVCMAPCASGYSPALGGLTCGRSAASAPKRCPHAYVTLAAERFGRNTGAARLADGGTPEGKEYREKCGELAPDALHSMLPEAVCWQTEAARPGEFASADVSAMCYEMLCSKKATSGAKAAATAAARPSFCASFVSAPRAVGGSAGIAVILTSLVAVMVLAVVASRVQMKLREKIVSR